MQMKAANHSKTRSTPSSVHSNAAKRGGAQRRSQLNSPDPRSSQLADIAAAGDDDNAECAAADFFREFPPAP
jgi:hypothetical protein